MAATWTGGTSIEPESRFAAFASLLGGVLLSSLILKRDKSEDNINHPRNSWSTCPSRLSCIPRSFRVSRSRRLEYASWKDLNSPEKKKILNSFNITVTVTVFITGDQEIVMSFFPLAVADNSLVSLHSRSFFHSASVLRLLILTRSGGCNDLFQDVGISSSTDIDDACCATWDTKEIVQLVQLAVLWILHLPHPGLPGFRPSREKFCKIDHVSYIWGWNSQ